MPRRPVKMQLSREWQEVSLVGSPSLTTGLTLLRGLPLGYLTQLEERLADTELALFEALATLRSLGYDETALIKASVKAGNESRQGKQARMEEWGKLPLRDGMSQDIRNWWQAKAENYITHQPTRGWTQAQHNPISVNYSPAATANIASNAAQAFPATSAVETTVSTGTPPNHQGSLHYGNDSRQLPPPETVASREHTIPEVSTGYRSMMPRDAENSDLQVLDARDGDKAALLASTQSYLYF
ncbi:hypothetical protein EIK77_003691 [Talaromyces pinophilus]|nr:hypothetical protein EIK77_003691 [Talaromyces pinophilus]